MRCSWIKGVCPTAWRADGRTPTQWSVLLPEAASPLTDMSLLSLMMLLLLWIVIDDQAKVFGCTRAVPDDSAKICSRCSAVNATRSVGRLSDEMAMVPV